MANHAQIRGAACGQSLTIQADIIVAETRDYLSACFDLSPDWAGKVITAHISQGGTRWRILLDDNGCIRPAAHLNLAAGDWDIWLSGNSNDGQRITSDVATLHVLPTGIAEGEEPLPEIPLPMAEQILIKAQQAEEIARSVREDADAGLFDGKDGQDGKSAYDIAVANGYTGTEAEWLDSLRATAGGGLWIAASRPEESPKTLVNVSEHPIPVEGQGFMLLWAAGNSRADLEVDFYRPEDVEILNPDPGALGYKIRDGAEPRRYKVTVAGVDTAPTIAGDMIRTAAMLGDGVVQIVDAPGGGGGVDQAYVDAQDAATLDAAKAYADQQDTATLEAANSYADQQDADTLTSANGHTDDAVGKLAIDLDNKADRAIYLLDNSAVTQTDARDILGYADQYSGLIEFVSTSESKVAAVGYILSNLDGTCLVTLAPDGTVTQWAKDSFAKHQIEARNLINDPNIDTDNLTVDVAGNPPVLYMLRAARNKPGDAGPDGAMMVVPQAISKQLFIYTDLDTGKMWTKVVTGVADAHSFGVWTPLGGGGSAYTLPVASKDTLGGIKADKAQGGDTKGVYVGDDQMLHVAPDVLVVQATLQGNAWVTDVGSDTIRGFGGSVILKATVDGMDYVYRYQRYGAIGQVQGAIFDQANITKDQVERVEVIVTATRRALVVRTPYKPAGTLPDGGADGDILRIVGGVPAWQGAINAATEAM